MSETMPVSEKHSDGVDTMENLLKTRGCACVRHGNVGGAELDLACACREPITLIDVETDKSIRKNHTKHQIFVMQQYTENNETRAAVIVTDGMNLCGIPVNEGGKQILEEHNLPKCSSELRQKLDE